MFVTHPGPSHCSLPIFLAVYISVQTSIGATTIPELRTSTPVTTESTQPSETSPSVNLDIYLQGPNGVSVEEPAALTLVTAAAQLYRQGTTTKGHLRWSEVAPMQYEIQDQWLQVMNVRFKGSTPDGTGEVRVTIQLRAQAVEGQVLSTRLR